jgi:hypothetical protein
MHKKDPLVQLGRAGAWRLVTDYIDLPSQWFANFLMLSNAKDAPQT